MGLEPSPETLNFFLKIFALLALRTRPYPTVLAAVATSGLVPKTLIYLWLMRVVGRGVLNMGIYADTARRPLTGGERRGVAWQPGWPSPQPREQTRPRPAPAHRTDKQQKNAILNDAGLVETFEVIERVFTGDMEKIIEEQTAGRRPDEVRNCIL